MRRDNVDGTGQPELANDFKPRLAVSMPSPPYLVYVMRLITKARPPSPATADAYNSVDLPGPTVFRCCH
jgi:hypothetical protein